MNEENAAARIGLDLNDPDTLGLVQRLYWGRLVVAVEAAGLEREDGLQELVLRLLEKQRGRSAWTPTRGGRATYVAVAGRSALADWVKAQARMRQRDGGPGLGRDAALEGT